MTDLGDPDAVLKAAIDDATLPMSAERLAAGKKWAEGIRSESDRACAVLAGAFLDALLDELLRKVFIAKVTSELLEQSRPLGSFSARIDVAFGVALVSEDVW